MDAILDIRQPGKAGGTALARAVLAILAISFGLLIISFIDTSVWPSIDRLAAMAIVVVALTYSFSAMTNPQHRQRTPAASSIEALALVLLALFHIATLVASNFGVPRAYWLWMPTIVLVLMAASTWLGPMENGPRLPWLWIVMGATLIGVALSAAILGIVDQLLDSQSVEGQATWIAASLFLFSSMTFAHLLAWRSLGANHGPGRPRATVSSLLGAALLTYGAVGVLTTILNPDNPPPFLALALTVGILTLWRPSEVLPRPSGPTPIRPWPDALRQGWVFFALSATTIVLSIALAVWGVQHRSTGLALPVATLAALGAILTSLVFSVAIQTIRRALLESLRALRIAQRESQTDMLTGLANRRGADRLLLAELQRAERYQREFSIALIDIDDFKEINDRLGHAAGDQVLREVAFTISSTVRTIDIPCRYGGEEFLTILPETGRQGAIVVSDRLRVALGAIEISGHPYRRGITVSIGVAAFPADASTPMDLLETADRALYRAKQRGKNQVAWQTITSSRKSTW